MGLGTKIVFLQGYKLKTTIPVSCGTNRNLMIMMALLIEKFQRTVYMHAHTATYLTTVDWFTCALTCSLIPT